MLVLSRKENEIIRIGEDIEVIVSKIKGNVVRLAISAPENVKILRSELGGWQSENAPQIETSRQAAEALWSRVKQRQR